MDVMGILVIISTVLLCGIFLRKKRREIKEFIETKEDDTEKTQLEASLLKIQNSVRKLEFETKALKENLTSFFMDSTSIKEQFQARRDSYVKEQDLLNKSRLEYLRSGELHATLGSFLHETKQTVLANTHLLNGFQNKMKQLSKQMD